jgi:cytidylate kinase
LVVAIDGPSGAGKSTVAKQLARRLDLPYLDTGAMYRALALKVLRMGIDPDDARTVEEAAVALELDLRLGDDGGYEVLLEGDSVEAEIRSSRVSDATSRISTHAGVRREMVKRQRALARQRGAVVEGRDIGTRVFPGTPYKFFLDAGVEVRAERRHRQLVESGQPTASMEQVRREVEERDHRDSHRRHSPLVSDDTYTLIDSSHRTVDEVVDAILDRIDEIASRGLGRSS